MVDVYVVRKAYRPRYRPIIAAEKTASYRSGLIFRGCVYEGVAVLFGKADGLPGAAAGLV